MTYRANYVERMLAEQAFMPPGGELARLTFQRYASESEGLEQCVISIT